MVFLKPRKAKPLDLPCWSLAILQSVIQSNLLKCSVTCFSVNTFGMFLTIMRLMSNKYTSTVNIIISLYCVYKHIMEEQISQNLLPKICEKDKYPIYLNRPIQGQQPTHTLVFESQCLSINQNSSIRHLIKTRDLIGFTHKAIDEKVHEIVINSFPKRPVTCSNNERRVLQHFSIFLHISSAQLEELKLILLQSSTALKITNISKPPKLLIYLNPNAGANSSIHHEAVLNFLKYTNFQYDTLETTHRGHCQQHLNQLDPSAYQGIVIISGDGLMHEFVNSDMCGKVPVTHIPGGSGNAFAKVQTSIANEQCRNLQAIYLAIKGKTQNMNLVLMQLQNEPKPIYSFMSLQWAFLADIDMNSQFLRCIGGLRFEVYAVYRCLKMRRYPGRITFSTTSTQLPPLNEPIEGPSFTTVETDFLQVIFLAFPYISDKFQWGPLIKKQEELIDLQFITSEQGRMNLIKYLLASDNGDHFDKQKRTIKEGINFDYHKVKSYRLEPLGEGDARGILGIDGQSYPSQKVQAFMSDRKVVVFA